MMLPSSTADLMTRSRRAMEIVTLIIVTSKNRFLGERSKYRFKMYKEGNVERERERERERK